MKICILSALRGFAEIYDKPISDELQKIWTNVLSDLTQDELDRAVKAYILDPKNVFFPKPGQIYGLAKPQGDKEEEAALIADRIFTCLRDHGSDSFGTNRARTRIGELGWNAIQNQGGWDAFIRSVISESDVSTLKSQMRKSIMGLIQRERSGISGNVPNPNQVSIESLGVKMKELK